MSSAPSELRKWSRKSWWGILAMVCAGQLSLIFWLGDTSPARPRVGAPPSMLSFATGTNGSGVARFLTLNDPTLFARPHRQGFSGLGWMTPTNPVLHAYVWSEEPAWLGLSKEQLGTSFRRFPATNTFNALQLLAQVEPDLTFPAIVSARLFPEHSELRITGGLAGRALVAPLELPSIPNVDLLTNSVVQTLVDAEGATISATLLLPGSGSKEADQKAIALARNARFAPVAATPALGDLSGARGLTWGQLIFAWHTVPVSATNGPSAGTK